MRQPRMRERNRTNCPKRPLDLFLRGVPSLNYGCASVKNLKIHVDASEKLHYTAAKFGDLDRSPVYFCALRS